MTTAEDLKQAEALVKALKKKQEAEKLTRWLDFRYFIDHVSNSPVSEKLVLCSASGTTKWDLDSWDDAKAGQPKYTTGHKRRPFSELRSCFDFWCSRMQTNVLFTEPGIFVHFKIDYIWYAKSVKKKIIVDTAKYHKTFHRHEYQDKVQRTRKDDIDKGYVLTVTFQYETPEVSRPLIKLLKRSNFSRVNEELVQGRSYGKMHTIHAFLKNENPQDTEAKEILLRLCKLFTSRDFSKRWARHKSHYNPVLEFPAKVESERIKKERDTPPKKENTLRGYDPQSRERIEWANPIEVLAQMQWAWEQGVRKEAIDNLFAVYNKAKKKAKEAKRKKKKIKKFKKLTK